VTVAAHKGKDGACLDQKHAVIYRGPFREAVDDDNHVFRRGVRTAVCAKTYHIFSQEPYRSHVELIPPRVLVPLEEAPPFACGTIAPRRDPRETKGADDLVTTEARSGTCAAGRGTDERCC
jgi:hypothetical protein